MSGTLTLSLLSLGIFIGMPIGNLWPQHVWLVAAGLALVLFVIAIVNLFARYA